MSGSRRVYAFRADASLHAGTGHVMRCLTLADALRATGAECRFICRAHPGHLAWLIRERGYEVDLLPQTLSSDSQDYDDRLGSDWATDARETGAITARGKPDWLVVDHYAIDSRWEGQLRSTAHKILVVEDLATRVHDCDALLDQTFGRVSEDYRDRLPASCTVLAGSRYALLRPQFAALRASALERRQTARLRQILISMGGFDQANVTLRVLESLRALPLPGECGVTVVLRNDAPWLSQVQKFACDMPWPTQVLVDVADMATLMANADFGIGAAGSTSWERCALGLPSFLVITADNQRDVAAALGRAGAAYVAAEVADIPRALSGATRELLSAPGAFLRMSEAASQVTDGKGVSRVLQHLDPEAVVE